MRQNHALAPADTASTESGDGQPHISSASNVASSPSTTSIGDSPVLRFRCAPNGLGPGSAWADAASSSASPVCDSASAGKVVGGSLEIMQNVELQESETPEVASPTGSRWSDSEEEERTYLLSKPRKESSSSKLRLKRSIAVIGKAFRREK